MSAFQQRKEQILAQLSIPSESYSDASPKGSVDEGILELVDQINKLNGLVTTSSCAGRISVYQEGHKVQSTTEENAQSSSITGKGGGKWLFVSHEPVSTQEDAFVGAASRLLCLPTPNETETTNPESRFVHLKFEPMILHILCSSLDAARKTLAAALTAGFRESGISSINDEQDLVMVAVRSAGLAFDSIVAMFGDNQITTIVSETYLETLIKVANERFIQNSSRKARFQASLLAAFDEKKHNGHRGSDWEPAAIRRERKRAEGMQRRDELRARQEGQSQTVPVEDLVMSIE